MRRICACILFILFTSLTLAGCEIAAENVFSLPSIKSYREIPGITDDEIAAIEALISGRDEFKYGTVVGTEAFVWPDGAFDGFMVKFCDLLTELFSIRFRIELYEWDELVNGLDDLSVDFMGDMTPTEERAQTYFMTSPIAQRGLLICTHVDSGRIRTEADVRGLKIGFLEDTITADSIRKAYPAPFVQVDVPNHEMAARMIERGEIDAFVDEAIIDPAFANYAFIRSRVFFPLVHETVSMATANGELAPVISAVSKYIDAGGIDRLNELYREGDFEYARFKLAGSFTDAERAYIEDLSGRGEAVSVATEFDNYPIGFYNQAEGRFEGIAVDVLSEISKLTGIRFETAVGNDMAWSDIFDMLDAGEVQMSAQLLGAEARRGSFLRCTEPYASSPYVLVSRLDYPFLAPYQVARVSVGGMKQSGKVDVYRQLFPNNPPVVEFYTQNDCLDALERGDIDLLVASEYTLFSQINYREKSGYKVNIKLDAMMESYFGFAFGEDLLCSIISKAQDFVAKDLIVLNWTGRHYDYSKRLAEERTFYFAISLVILSVALVVCVFMLIKNKRLSAKLGEIASHDALTGVLNRRFFLEQAAISIARSQRLSSECFIIIFDMDEFKFVNDRFGHLAGDNVLKEVAHRITNTIRSYDLFGRYGGEEFIMLMSDIDKGNVIPVVERIRNDISSVPVEYDGKCIPISASFGIAFAAPINDLYTAIKCADMALYQAKESGRNLVVFYDECCARQE